MTPKKTRETTKFITLFGEKNCVELKEAVQKKIREQQRNYSGKVNKEKKTMQSTKSFFHFFLFRISSKAPHTSWLNVQRIRSLNRLINDTMLDTFDFNHLISHEHNACGTKIDFSFSKSQLNRMKLFCFVYVFFVHFFICQFNFFAATREQHSHSVCIRMTAAVDRERENTIEYHKISTQTGRLFVLLRCHSHWCCCDLTIAGEGERLSASHERWMT